MKESIYKKTMVLIPSAFNSKAMGDIENFIIFYKDIFDLYIIWDKKSEIINGVKYISKFDSKAQYLITTADYIIDAGTINGTTKINNNQTRISVWHGTPYKKMFVDLDPTNINEALKYDYGVDLMISPSKFYTEEFLRKSMLYDGKILETAISRTDSLYITDEEKRLLKKSFHINENKKILLYAPTYRNPGKVRLHFDAGKLKKSLEKDGSEWVIVTKLHYLNKLINKRDVIDCTSYPNINNLLAISDVVVTDYSSLFIDYSILDKPVIFYQYDKKDYDSDRGFMFSLEKYVDKKYIIENENELYELASKIEKKPNLKKVRSEFYPYQKENSTKDLVKKLDLNADSRKTKEIIFLINEVNQLGGVNNFVMNFSRYFKKNYNSKIIIVGIKEFNKNNNENYILDEDNLVDIKVSYENHPKLVKSILENTDGYIITCQFSAQKKFQSFLKNKNVFLMFHGNGYDFVNRNYYTWHLDAINKKKLYNYKKFLLLTEDFCNAIKEAVIPQLKDRIGYIENSYDFNNRKDYYKKSNEFAVLSRLDDDKNIFDIIKIFSNKNLDENFKVHVYGDGKLREKFIEEIKSNKLEKKVIVHGYVEDKNQMYKDKQGLIMTTLSEGFGLIILEAANYGIPTYIYESAVAVREFKKSNVINVVETSNIEDYVNKLNNPKKFRKEDFDNIVSMFSNEKIFDRWINLFSEIENENCVNPHLKQVIKKNIKSFISNIKTNLKTNIKKLLNKDTKQKDRKNRIKTYLKYIYDRYKYYIFKLKRLTINRYKEPLVSIIVPFYNCNDTIEALLKSIKKSGYKNYEVIVINDGSSDDPRDIIKNYKKVRYYYKKNEGIGLTRNYGLEKMKGKYFCFFDADDTMYKGALNYLVDYAIKNKLPLVAGQTQRIILSTKKRSYWFRKIYKKNYVNKMSDRTLLLDDSLSTNKLYETSAYKKSGIKFDSGLYEDKLFSFELYSYYDKIGIINNIVYNWLVYGNNSSITTTASFDNIKERIKRMEQIYNMCDNNFKRAYVKFFVTHDLAVFINDYNRYSNNDKKKIFDMYREFFIKTKKYIYFNNILNVQKRVLFQLLLKNDFSRFDLLSTYLSTAFQKKKYN